MNIEIDGKSYELKYTFNSFKHMKELNLDDLQDCNKYPFKMFSIVSTLFAGAINHNPKSEFSSSKSDSLLEKYCESNSTVKLLESLMEMLQENGFFKSLQQ